MMTDQEWLDRGSPKILRLIFWGTWTRSSYFETNCCTNKLIYLTVWTDACFHLKSTGQVDRVNLKLQKVKDKHTHLSASISRGLLPCAQPLTIQAVSKAARKPRAQPVPIGQKGCKQRAWGQPEHAQAKSQQWWQTDDQTTLTTHTTPTATGMSLPQVDCLPPVQLLAGVHVSPWSKQHSLKHTCWWSQTWPHLAAHSGWWHSPGMATGSLCRSQLPHGHKRAMLPGWHFQGWAVALFLCSPVCRQEKESLGQDHWHDTVMRGAA